MKCDECLNLIEEYIEGELDERIANFINAHVAGCAACAKVYDGLQREQEMYAGFIGEVKESPALWFAVQTGIEKESVAQATHTASLTCSQFSKLFSLPRLSLAIALALLVIGLGIEVARRLSSQRSTHERLAVSSQPGGLASTMQNTINPAAPANAVNADAQVEASDKQAKRVPLEGNAPRDELSKHSMIATSNSRWNNKTQQDIKTQQIPVRRLSPPISIHKELLAFSPEMTGVAQQRLKFNSLLDRETSRHLEKSEVLLRSLRNASRTDAAPVSDISYERRMSQELLNKNILLRRNAAARGDVLTENLLSRLEPLLLDIANLQESPSSTELRSIGQRIGEKEMIATLQAYIG